MLKSFQESMDLEFIMQQGEFLGKFERVNLDEII